MQRPKWQAFLLSMVMLACSLMAVVLPASPAHADPGCQREGYYVIYARGATAPLFSAEQKEALKHIHHLLPGAAWAELGNIDGTVHEDTDPKNNVPDSKVNDEYPASGFTYPISVNIGVNELVKHLNDRYNRAACATETLILVGYSEGANVVGEAMNRSDLSSSAKTHIGYVALFGDPKFKGYFSGVPAWAKGTAKSDHSSGFLFARNPYVPDWLTGRLGSWCDDEDGFCNGYPWMGNHGSIYREYWFRQSAATIVAMAKLKKYQLTNSHSISLFTTQEIALLSSELAKYGTLPFAVPAEIASKDFPGDPFRPTAIKRDSGNMEVFYKDTAGNLIARGWSVTSGWNY
ncbi:MAG: cutinase family protein, partial [Candidatus Woesebacteria bacterium]